MPSNHRIALVTASQMHKPDTETHLLVDVLRERGVEAEIVCWDAHHDWRQFTLVLIRTPWDYFYRLEEFLAWAHSVSKVTCLINPYAVIEWNCRKHYLKEVSLKGINTIPTLWFKQGSANMADLLARSGWDEVVVKPTVSAGAFGTIRTPATDPGCMAHLQSLLEKGDAMVQPFAPDILHHGEVSLIYFAETFSHAIRKVPRKGDYRVQDQYGGIVEPHTPTDEEMALGRSVLGTTPSPTTYARVDLVRWEGKPALIELEVIEPMLFLEWAPDSAQRLASTVVKCSAKAMSSIPA